MNEDTDTTPETNTDGFLLNQAKRLVNAMDYAADQALPEELTGIVKFHSKGAAAAALASGWLPGVGGVTAVIISGGFIWSMYGRIGERIGLPFSKNILKSLASGVATNIAAGVAGTLALSTAFSFIPGIGSIGATVIIGATCYAIKLISGYIYLKIMTTLFLRNADLAQVDETKLNDMAKSTIQDIDIQTMLKEAKNEFHEKRKQGEFN